MQQANCIPGLPMPPPTVESQLTQLLNHHYYGRIPFLITGCNDVVSGRMNPSQTESLSLIMEEISKSECLKNKLPIVLNKQLQLPRSYPDFDGVVFVIVSQATRLPRCLGSVTAS